MIDILQEPQQYNKDKVAEIRKWFKERNIKRAVINISGGADSTYVAYLLTAALGKENVIGLLQPNGEQKDISDAKEVVKTLDIKHYIFDINKAFTTIDGSLMGCLARCYEKVSQEEFNAFAFDEAAINLAPRLRMVYAYMVANAVHGVVVGTGNASERYVGYFTKWGDGACDYNPIKNLLKTDLIQAGLALGIPQHLIKKTPSDGLTGKTDEEKYGFTYEVLDEYIRTGVCEDWKIKEKIDKMHADSRHKFEEI